MKKKSFHVLHYFVLFLILTFSLSVSFLFINSCKNAESTPYDVAVNAQDNNNQNNNQTNPVTQMDSSSIALALQNNFRKIAKTTLPAVVHITSIIEKEQPAMPFWFPFFPDMPQQKREYEVYGSGFIISKDGYILTNNHVIKDAKEVKVILQDGTVFKGKVMGVDPDVDVACIKINPDKKILPVLKLGDSDDLQVGDIVIAIGNPFGLDGTVTQGIVSAKGRYNLGINKYESFIQIDAAINPGNSGGPLLNLKGEVVGINDAILSKTGQSAGIGFAIPINMVKNNLESLKKNIPIERGYLGVSIEEMTEDKLDYYKLDKPQGVIVASVEKGSPADKAGIKRLDVILKFNNKTINSVGDLVRYIASTPVGKKVTLTIIRSDGKNSKKINITLTLEKRKTLSASTSSTDNWLGVAVSNLTDDLKSKYNIYGINKGVVILGFGKNSIAEKAGLEKGDVIMQINDKEVGNLDDFYKIMDEYKKYKKFLLLVYRRGTVFIVSIKK